MLDVMQDAVNIQCKIISPLMGTALPLPSYATPWSAGLDLRACIAAPMTVEAGATYLIPTGLAVFIANPALAGMILPRSSLGHKHGLVLGNLVGLIDADYQGELKISCWNRSNLDYVVQPGERIAQLVIVPIVRAQFTLTADFDPTTRGEGGFGHSGSY